MLKTENMETAEIADDSSIVKVKSALEKDESPDTLICKVPQYLSANNPEFYSRKVISFGPYNFKKEDPEKEEIERLKSEVARKMHLKMQFKKRGGLVSVIEEFKSKEIQDKIKECYSKEIELSGDMWAWMIVRDACFLLEVLDRFGEDNEQSDSPFIDRILRRRRHHPLLTEIVKDMLKMESQLPFWVLERIRSDILGPNDDAVESALKKLSPIEVEERTDREYKRTHLLQLLHDYIVARPESSNQPLCCSNILSNIQKINSSIIRFEIRCSPKACIKGLFYTIALLLLSPVLIILFLWGIIFVILQSMKDFILGILLNITECKPHKDENTEKHVPSVEELRRTGVKFKKLEGDEMGISHIKFEHSTLYLPRFNVDNKSEVIVRNLIALEMCSRGEEKPITRYTILMNDLVDTGGHVGILRREDIISGKLGSDDEIAQLWNSMVTTTEMPRYNSIDKTASSINHFYKKRSKGLVMLNHRRLWAKIIGWLIQIILVYCSRPWLFLSSIAGLLLLLLTFVQVFCLFKSCQLK